MLISVTNVPAPRIDGDEVLERQALDRLAQRRPPSRSSRPSDSSLIGAPGGIARVTIWSLSSTWRESAAAVRPLPTAPLWRVLYRYSAGISP